MPTQLDVKVLFRLFETKGSLPETSVKALARVPLDGEHFIFERNGPIYRAGVIIHLAYPGDKTRHGLPDSDVVAEVFAYRIASLEPALIKAKEGALERLPIDEQMPDDEDDEDDVK